MYKCEDMDVYSAHFADDLSPEAYAFLRDVAMLDSRYIFTERKGKKKFGYCTHCQESFPTNLTHGHLGKCPSCGSQCRVRASGIKRKYLVDQALMVWYDRSIIDPQAITARCVWCVRDYRGDYRNVQTIASTIAIYVFRPGKAVMYKRPYWFNFRDAYSLWRNRYYYSAYYDDGPLVGEFYQAARPHPISDQNVSRFLSRESIAEAVKGTPFQYSCWEQYEIDDMTRFFGLYAVAPCVEYLTKLHMKNLVIDKLHGAPTYGAINWRGKSLLGVLKLTKQQYEAIRAAKIEITFEFLAAYQATLKDGSRLTPVEVSNIAKLCGRHIREMISISSGFGVTLKKAAAWADKQMNLGGDRTFASFYHLVDTWKTYLDECRQLNLDMTDESVILPKNLWNAHQNTLTQIKVKANEALSAKIREISKKRAKLRFSFGGLVAIPAKTAQELINEGRALNHCVGTYAERVALGQTIIMFIRKEEEPDTPFFTMEIRDNKVFQCRGRENCNPTPEVHAFIEEFKKAKLSGRKGRSKQPVDVPA